MDNLLGHPRPDAVLGVLVVEALGVPVLVTLEVRRVPPAVHDGLLQQTRTLK